MPAESTEVLIVGAGACGCLVAKELAERGFSVVVLEAGKRISPAVDLQNTETNAAKILWVEPRVYSGRHGIAPKAGMGVGGGTLAWLGVMPRFHPADFRTYSTVRSGLVHPDQVSDRQLHLR